MAPSVEGHIPPHNFEVERAVLGAVLIDPDLLHQVMADLKVSAFYHEHHRIAWKAMLAMAASNTAIDMASLGDEMRRQGYEGDDAALLEIVTGFTEGCPSPANILHHAQILVDLSYRRLILGGCNKTLNLAYDMQAPLDDSVASLSRIIQGVSGDQSTMATSAASVERAWTQIDDTATTGRYLGFPTGLPSLDAMIGGVKRGELTIVAGRPSMGKTALACQLMDYWSIRHKLPALYFSLETDAAQIAINSISRRSLVASNIVASGKGDFEALQAVSAEIAGAPRWIDDSATLDARKLQAKARQVHSMHNIELVVVDFLQLMRYDKSKEVSEINEIMWCCKNLARDLNVAFILVSQLNRKCDARDDHRPRKSDLRGSGAAEEQADKILMVYRPDYYKPGDQPGYCEIVVAKQRNGPTGIVGTYFRRDCLRFEEER